MRATRIALTAVICGAVMLMVPVHHYSVEQAALILFAAKGLLIAGAVLAFLALV